jgi:Uma2 family endonuclease
MNRKISTIKMTARQFQELGEDPVGVRLELVDGAVAVYPSQTPRHSAIIVSLSYVIGKHISHNQLGHLFGDVDTFFGLYDVRRPDLLYFSTARLHFVGKTALEGPPDLCVEIVSPSSLRIDRKDKFKQYAKGKVKNYWIVNPMEKTVEGFRLVAGKYRLAGSGKNDDVISLPPFKDLEIPLGKLWYPDRGH